MKRALVAASIIGIALLTYFQFPGHTWLQQDTQIYVPILEHLRDPAVLRNEMLVVRPHVSFTLYDEIAISVRRITGLGFHQVLGAQQVVTRALGVWGVYLMATALGLATGPALLVAAILSLGAVVLGPTVLMLEYEPGPRAFAVPLLFLATGLVAHGRDLAAGVAGAVAFLIHPPTVYPFWGVYFLLVLVPGNPVVMRRRLMALAPLLAATLILLAASRLQTGVGEPQNFFERLGAGQEQMQRVRASYVYVSLWLRDLFPHYLVLCAIAALGYVRLRRRVPYDMRWFLIGLPVVGALSVPVSYLLLEHMKWSLMPQLQPVRALLFLEFVALFVAAAAGAWAAMERRILEALLWFAAAFVAPAGTSYASRPSWDKAAVIAGLALLACAACWIYARKLRWAPAAMAAAVLAPFFAIPGLAHVRNYPHSHSPELEQLVNWARASTPQDAIFLFGDARRDTEPGIFRAEALRAVYVDWKGGGQVNYLRDLGELWWRRWQEWQAAKPTDFAKFRTWGIQYVVLKKPAPGVAAIYHNSRYWVYRL